MEELEKLETKELKQIQGGGFGIACLIGAGIVFLIGIIDGYIRPLKCH